MIWLLPIFHSWKSPETGDLCHVCKNAGLWRGGYKRGLPGWRSLQGAGLFLSRAGLFLSRAGLFWPHHWIQRISRIYVLQSVKPTKTLPRKVVYNSGDLLGGCDSKMRRQTDYQWAPCFPVNLCRMPIFLNKTGKKTSIIVQNLLSYHDIRQCFFNGTIMCQSTMDWP